MAEQLAATGIFMVNNSDIAPAGGAITCIPGRLDYLGCEAPATDAATSPLPRRPAIRPIRKTDRLLSAWLTEEGNSL